MTISQEKTKISDDMDDVLLSVRNLKTYYPILGGILKRQIGSVQAVDDVSFDIHKQETVGLVGESGCGKTTIGNTILNLVEATDGEIYYKGERIDNNFTLSTRKKIQMVFQDPDAALNPRWKVVNIIGEPLRNLEGMKKRRRVRSRVLELLETVSMKAEHLDRYPHEFSGGQKQRIIIARALACNPELIILDEPTSALDVSVQAQILNLLKDLQTEFDLSYLFITHDLSVVQHIADRVKVMYLGKFVESGTVNDIFKNPSHPYTRALLSARPSFDPTARKNRIILEGDVPSPINPPSGCAFHPRCPEKEKHKGCGVEDPRKIDLGGETGEHYMQCLPFKEGEEKSYEGRQFISD